MHSTRVRGRTVIPDQECVIDLFIHPMFASMPYRETNRVRTIKRHPTHRDFSAVNSSLYHKGRRLVSCRSVVHPLANRERAVNRQGQGAVMKFVRAFRKGNPFLVKFPLSARANLYRVRVARVLVSRPPHLVLRARYHVKQRLVVPSNYDDNQPVKERGVARQDAQERLYPEARRREEVIVTVRAPSWKYAPSLFQFNVVRDREHAVNRRSRVVPMGHRFVNER